ncbi:TonB-dependent receptor domain-containing protein [Aliikangiella coralliicola]|uniref:Fe-regulated protein B n=1 Tax=Aliikangiella coralliicola TaxID=2592383 RepID=A0A545U639_9GAMM|nr:TonB-dependent receptor [Aliikangiella coralliicola]TQV84926.1 Fe-regulated protein B [Aliikangiella coralliicola]
MFRGFRLRKVVVISSLLLNPLWVIAAETDSESNSATEEKAAEEENMIVWGTRVTSNSVYMDDETIAIKQADHISDLLRAIPGVDVGGAHSLNQRITIRSMDDKDLRITIDGANQNTYMYHHLGNLQIHADILKAVDVEVGKNSVIDGGLGGAVRFETKQAKELLRGNQTFGGRLQASYNDNASNGYSFSGFGQLTDELDVLAYFNAIERDNFEVGGGKILDADGNEIAGTDGTVRGLKGDLDDALIKFGWDVNANHRFEFGYEAYNDEGNYSYRPDMGLATDIAIADSLNIPIVYPTKFTRDTITLNYDVTTENSTLKFVLFDNESTLWRDERGLIAWRPPFATINEGEAQNTGFNLIATTRLNQPRDHVLTYGVDIINYKTQYRVDGADISGEEATNRSLYIEDRIDFDNGFSLIPGLRYDSFDIQSKVVDKTFNETTAAIAAEYRVNKSLLLRASTTQLFKGPEIGETFIGAGLYDTPNPDIEAETGTNSEISVAYQGKGLGADNLRTGITFFNTEIENHIYDYASNPNGPRTWKDNIGDMTIDGFEAYLGYSINNLTALLTFSNSDSELSAFADYSSLDGSRIDRIQGDTISFNLDYDFDLTDLSLNWNFMVVDDVPAGPDLDGPTLLNNKEGFTVHNISARWLPQSVEGLALTLGVDNLFDEFYASQSSRTGVSSHPLFGQLYLLDYEPGRNIKMTISYQF